MRIAYLDCATGIAGDMTLAALIDAGVDAEAIRAGIDSLGLPGVRLVVEPVVKGGFRATHVRVEHPEQHAHRHLSDILRLIENASALSDPQRARARRIFEAIARAEATVHGTTVEKIHFHEVGAVDSIVDVVGAAVGFDLLAAGQIVSSPVPTGRGWAEMDHGVCSLPAPGTAELLKGIPLVDVPVEAELTTPTGAAILASLVDRFAHLPEMTVEAIGYGAGSRDFPDRPNVLRLFVGTATRGGGGDVDHVELLETNLDDVSGEIVGHTKQKLLDSGALDVYAIPVQMKKDRPGVILSVICRPAEVDTCEAVLFEETGTLGIRRVPVRRSKRLREEITVETPWGPVRGKLGRRGGVRESFSPEFDDCARVAAEQGLPLRDVYRAAESAFLQRGCGSVSRDPTVSRSPHEHDHDHDR